MRLSWNEIRVRIKKPVQRRLVEFQSVLEAKSSQKASLLVSPQVSSERRNDRAHACCHQIQTAPGPGTHGKVNSVAITAL